MLTTKHFLSMMVLAFLICFSNSFAQNALKSDTSKAKVTIVMKKNPKVATLLSLVAPGTGQVYNGKYWKAPIVWGGLITLAYFGIDNDKNYTAENNYLKTLIDTTIYKVNIFKTDPKSQAEFIRHSSYADAYRRYRDFNWLGFTALYIYQVVDACVDAHLSEFDMSENIGLKLSPYMKGSSMITAHSGLSLTIRFKNKE